MPIALALAVLVGVALGIFGGGGSILTTPVLLYVLGLPAREAIATSLVVVGATSLAALVPHARAGRVAWRTGLVFGAAGMAGAFVGGFVAAWLPEELLLALFAAMMFATAVAMLRPSRARAPVRRPLPQVLGDGLVVGLVTGLVGAGGGFLVVPALVLLGGLVMEEAVGTSLLVIVLKSLAGLAGHAAHVQVDYMLAFSLAGAAAVGSVGGAWFVGRVPALALRRGFGGFILVMAIVVLVQEV